MELVIPFYCGRKNKVTVVYVRFFFVGCGEKKKEWKKRKKKKKKDARRQVSRYWNGPRKNICTTLSYIKKK